MELDAVKKTPRQHPVSDSQKSFIITGPKPALSRSSRISKTNCLVMGIGG
ncbi:hypothetical protein MRS76_23990 [Rhizobiaceae bacterium n13]|uniref:Uncharacterized protein n=1 Tax=Ferirhizobium litorale TaxID=2927786 RepID=A0AAE3QFZ1_9HYPH|nr:hypothetical protein [Fererhizobium litorale]MDI7864989.1 hypothetical protein [Fererhizobium litorale]MDI7925082.1 hypothetical protein [Fererhizobium litorale]